MKDPMLVESEGDQLRKLKIMARLLYRVVLLASCWCTEPKYWKNIPPTKCLRCVALEQFKKDYPDVVKAEIDSDAPQADPG